MRSSSCSGHADHPLGRRRGHLGTRAAVRRATGSAPPAGVRRRRRRRPHRIAGMRMLLDHAGLVVEPSAALGIAAILEDRDRFARPTCSHHRVRQQRRRRRTTAGSGPAPVHKFDNCSSSSPLMAVPLSLNPGLLVDAGFAASRVSSDRRRTRPVGRSAGTSSFTTSACSAPHRVAGHPPPV